MNAPLHVHAIYLCLSDASFLEASVRSIYDQVDGITITSTYDRDWKGVKRQPDELVDLVLSRAFDPDRKIDLIVGSETSEARSRNRAMDYADPRGSSRRVKQQHPGDAARPPIDYFLIVDADEIWERDALSRLLAHAARTRRALYRAPAVRYFKLWTYRVDGYEWSTALVRSDVRLDYLRNRKISLWRRAVSRLPVLPARARWYVRRSEDVAPEIATFHHGSYVGPRERIVEKLGSFGHAHEVGENWITDVWDRWTPESRDFNPAWPDLYRSAHQIAVGALPAEIRDFSWPAGYLT